MLRALAEARSIEIALSEIQSVSLTLRAVNARVRARPKTTRRGAAGAGALEGRGAESRLALAELRVVQVGVEAPLRKQLVMVALLDDVAV